MAVADAQYRFIYVDIGKYFSIIQKIAMTALTCSYIYAGDAGRHSDGGVLANSAFGKALAEDSLNFPQHRPLPGTCIKI